MRDKSESSAGGQGQDLSKPFAPGDSGERGIEEEFPLPSIPGVDDWAHRVAPRVKIGGASLGEDDPLPSLDELLKPDDARALYDEPTLVSSVEVSPPTTERLKGPKRAPKRPTPNRKVSRKRVGFRVGLVLTGAALCVGAWLTGPELLAEHFAALPEPYRAVVASTPPAELTFNGTVLGQTPKVVEWEEGTPQVVLARKGFLSQAFSLDEETSRERIGKYVVPLDFAPVALDWSGLPKDSQIWWNGELTDVSGLQHSLPGDYQVKVKPPREPAVAFSIQIPEPSLDQAPIETLSLGATCQEHLANRPRVRLGLTEAKPASRPASPVLEIFQVGADGKPAAFQEKVTLSEKEAREVILPGGGSYSVRYTGDSKFKPFVKTLAAETGKVTEFSVAFEPVPIPTVQSSSPSWSPSGSSGGGGYRPAYRPPPPRPSGGGGGGGRIAPPSF